MKNLLKVEGIEILTAKQQKNINGGRITKSCSDSCVGKPTDVLGACFHNGSCDCPGICLTYHGCVPA